MCKVTFLRILFVVSTGIFLYRLLLFTIGMRSGKRLKIRSNHKNREKYTPSIAILYYCSLTGLIILGFLMIKYYIRG